MSGLAGYARCVKAVGRGNGVRERSAIARRGQDGLQTDLASLKSGDTDAACIPCLQPCCGAARLIMSVVQPLRFSARLTPSAISVQATPDSRYTVTATGPKRADTPSATSGASAAPISQARSVVTAAPV